ncbi:MAG: hypothetical protein IJK14_00855 [Clostridia bacterium]|nr:hypothetical protein [Clostridia bacterium]MBR0443912.1 hypothetical protein [Clostridia bacterium]
MKLRRFTLAVCMNKGVFPDFDRERAWKCVSDALYPDDVENADLFEYSKGSVYGCVLTNLKLGKSRNIARSLSRNLPVIASVDWARPFMLHNEVELSAEPKQIGKIVKDGVFVPDDGEELAIVFSGPKGKRWINPWKKKRMLLLWPDGRKGAQQIAREILLSSAQKQTDKDIIVFPVEHGFLPEILLYLNDFRLSETPSENGGVIHAATCSDGSVILGNIGSADLKSTAAYYSRLGYHRFIAETDSRPEEEVPDCETEYLDPSDHIRNLFTTYDFLKFAGWCDRAVAVVPGSLPEEAVSLLEEAGLKYEVFQTPKEEADRAAIVSALINN